MVRLSLNPFKIEFEGPLGACCCMVASLCALAAVLLLKGAV